jgi:Mrp family chromosome partitioning ATPase
MRSNDARAVMFTSASPRDGKTSAAINFAFVLAAAGFSVILFDFDLRRPDVGRRLGVSSDFMDLFRSDAKLEDLLREPPGAPGLRVISSREQGGETTALVDAVARRLPELLDRARQLADYVIVDTPPLGQISDGLRAAMVVDDVVLVARPGNTSRVELERTRELLDRMDRTPSGLVVIGLQTVGDAYETYGLEPRPPDNRGGAAPGAIDEALPWTDASSNRSERRRPGEVDEDRGARRSTEGGRKVRRMQAGDADELGAEHGKPITRPPA